MAQSPRVWLLSGYKAGDTTQMLALADALGWEYDVKRLAYRRTELLSNRLLGATLAGIRPHRSDRLEAPWPDLVITAGRRNEPVARWIRSRSQATRLVHLGRPWSALDCFDLVVTTPQYFVPPGPNVLSIDLPLHRVTAQRLAQWRLHWQAAFDHLPRPIWSVLLGGDSGPFVFTPEKAERLATWLNARVARERGAVLLTSSARTPAASYAGLVSRLAVPAYVYHWRADDSNNPYQGYLAHADRLVVTGESMSMLSEAAATGQPLYIFDLSDCPQHGRDSPQACPPWWRIAHNYRYKPLTHRLAMRFAAPRLRRDISRIQQHLVASGRAVWVGDRHTAEPGKPPVSDLEQVVERVRALFS